MSDRLEVVDVTCAASVPHTAPVETAFTFDGGVVRAIHIVIPAGHAGLTGIALGFGHQPILPFSRGAFIEGDDDVLHFPFNDRNPGAQWSAFTYNEDLQVHSWQVRFELDEIPDASAQRVTSSLAPADIIAAGNDALAEAL